MRKKLKENNEWLFKISQMLKNQTKTKQLKKIKKMMKFTPNNSPNSWLRSSKQDYLVKDKFKKITMQES